MSSRKRAGWSKGGSKVCPSWNAQGPFRTSLVLSPSPPPAQQRLSAPAPSRPAAGARLHGGRRTLKAGAGPPGLSFGSDVDAKGLHGSQNAILKGQNLAQGSPQPLREPPASEYLLWLGLLGAWSQRPRELGLSHGGDQRRRNGRGSRSSTARRTCFPRPCHPD